MRKSNRRVWSVMAVAVAITISAAAMTATDSIKQRHEAMGEIRDAMKNLGAIAKKEQPFDADVVAANAATIAGKLEEAAKLFPDGSEAGDVKTRAKSEIWTDRERFDEIFETGHQAAVDLQSVTDPKAFPPALGKLGNNCKSCHDLYRLPEN